MIFIALPNYDGQLNTGLAKALLDDVPLHKCEVNFYNSSMLTGGFNTLWCDALNKKADYFLMAHADINPTSRPWIKPLINELKAHEADAISVVSPIKDERGFTSTALTSKGDSNQRRLTIRECFQLPETFGKHEVAKLFGLKATNSQLLINTGLLLVDLKKHRKKMEKLLFRVRNEVEKDKNGNYSAWQWSEDWYWSRDASALGLKLLATRKIQIGHIGVNNFCNCHSWGTLARDDEGKFIAEKTKNK